MQIRDLKKNSKNGVIGIIFDKNASQLIDSTDIAISWPSRFVSNKVSKLLPGLNRSPEIRS
jgi:hypothetical protein